MNDEKLVTYNYYFNSNFQYKSSTKNFSIDLDYLELLALKNIIEYKFSTKLDWFFKKDSELNYSIVIQDFLEYDTIGKMQKVEYLTYIIFTGNNFSKISITSYIYQKNNNLVIKEILKEKNKEIVDYVKCICKKIKCSSVVDNYFLEPVQLCYGAVSGYFDFGRLIVDGGAETEIYNNPQVLLLKIKYSKIIVDDMPVGIPMNDSMMLDRIIVKTLIQLLLRFPLEDQMTDGIYYLRDSFEPKNKLEFDQNNVGKTYIADRTKIIDNKFVGFPNDSKKIIDKFYSLNLEKKNLFLKSCTSYINGLKSKSTKAIAYYVLALENIANYNSKSSHQLPKQGTYYNPITETNKKIRIYKTINNIYGEEIVSEDYINIIYKLRSSHFHNGLENNDIIENIFDVDEGDTNLVDSVERLTHSFLIKWLMLI